MGEKVIRYESEQQYLDYTNHRRYLATGKDMKFPNPQTDPDAYWTMYYREKDKNPEVMLETWTILIREVVDKETGKTLRQDCTYVTLGYKNRDEALASREKVREEEQPDPGKVIATFNTREDAELFRALAFKQRDEGQFYDIRHTTTVKVIDTNIEVPNRESANA